MERRSVSQEYVQREAVLCQLRQLIQDSSSVTVRLQHLIEFLHECEQSLASGDSMVRYHAFVEAAYLLSQRVGDAPLWDWLQEQCRQATAERQEHLRIALLELVPDPPIRFADLLRLWDMWFDPAARWAVYAAYYPFPRRLRSHLKRYSAHRRRHHLPVPDFDFAEFETWIAARA